VLDFRQLAKIDNSIGEKKIVLRIELMEFVELVVEVELGALFYFFHLFVNTFAYASQV
jgi:hypothetical protein